MWRSISRFTWSVFEFQQYQEGPERRDNDGTVWPKEELGSEMLLSEGCYAGIHSEIVMSIGGSWRGRRNSSRQGR